MMKIPFDMADLKIEIPLRETIATFRKRIADQWMKAYNTLKTNDYQFYKDGALTRYKEDEIVKKQAGFRSLCNVIDEAYVLMNEFTLLIEKTNSYLDNPDEVSKEDLKNLLNRYIK